MPATIVLTTARKLSLEIAVVGNCAAAEQRP